jgi:hypothetical protein
MADQARWFKLWCSAPSDDHLQRLPPALRWAWVAFGAYTKLHGTRGQVEVSASNGALAAQLGVAVEALIATLQRLPHLRVEPPFSDNGSYTVTWQNWSKYQEDHTVGERVKRLRSKKRREEIRRDSPLNPPAKPDPIVLDSESRNGHQPRTVVEVIQAVQRGELTRAAGQDRLRELGARR